MRKSIVVVGAGYTGMLSAVRIAHGTRRDRDVTVTLVNPSERFVERLRTHQTASGQELAVRRIPDLLDGSGVVFRQGSVTEIDTTRRRVVIDGTDGLAYDVLVIALGSRADTSLVPGSADHAFTLDEPGRLAARLAETDVRNVTVSGGGLTGVEAATEIAETRPDLKVTLVSRGEPAAMMGPRARAHMAKAFERLGVTVRVGEAVTKVLPDGVELADGTIVNSDATLWTSGVRVPDLATAAGITTDRSGRVVVDAELRSVSHPDVFAVGDAAAAKQAWGEIHGTCQSGMPTAAHAADNIVRMLRGRALKPFRFGYFHQPVSLGRRDAVIQFTHADDTPRRFALTGRAAVLYKEAVSSSPIPFFRMSRRFNVYPYLSKGGRTTR
ncbi:NAD(P)/FAD-dependent oxidoreductase [Actinomadura rupiterrae]|uniref:NAD(P)/FAD-dependent oxidoreductase n=1 Tax=Actinomadura rupiterrae TaxID=559627 RepID=UPI0020A3FCEB|nr:FAD-dependent oxidoreductase [Actinomadura rupiterrae]MCP2340753.1 NADH dehydrogenase FAD-containing subunit [Actinomadura rupiterrae]